MPEELKDEGRRALALPSERRLNKLTELIRASLALPADTGIEIHIWARRYSPEDLRPESYLLGHYRDEPAR